MERQQEEEEDQGPKLTVAYIKKFLKSDDKTYYSTPELNEVLYFQCKGFRKIENLDLFPDLRCIYLQSNVISKIEGFDKLTALKCLYLHENLLNKIEGLDSLVNLKVLNLCDNHITTIEGMSKLQQLESLHLGKNVIGKNGLSDLNGLLDLKSLTTLDLAKNYISDPAVVDEVLAKLPNIALIYLMGNEAPRQIPNYRKSMISKLPKLKYLDDRPVFEEDRRCAEAFVRGGLTEERKEREKMKQEKEGKEEQNRRAFEELINKAREEAKVEREVRGNESEIAREDLNTTISTVMSREERPETAPREEVKEEREVTHLQITEERGGVAVPEIKAEEKKTDENGAEKNAEPETSLKEPEKALEPEPVKEEDKGDVGMKTPEKTAPSDLKENISPNSNSSPEPSPESRREDSEPIIDPLLVKATETLITAVPEIEQKPDPQNVSVSEVNLGLVEEKKEANVLPEQPESGEKGEDQIPALEPIPDNQ